MTVPLNSNGHRRRELRKRVLAEEKSCALCDLPVDKKLKTTPGEHYTKCPQRACPGCIPHPMRPEVDEIVPRAKGGSPLSRDNTRLMHRRCNQFKGIKSLEQARTEWQAKHAQANAAKPQVTASPIW